MPGAVWSRGRSGGAGPGGVRVRGAGGRPRCLLGRGWGRSTPSASSRNGAKAGVMVKRGKENSLAGRAGGLGMANISLLENKFPDRVLNRQINLPALFSNQAF